MPFCVQNRKCTIEVGTAVKVLSCEVVHGATGFF